MRVRLVALCFVVLWTSPAIAGFATELLMNQLAFQQDKLHEMEQSIAQLQAASTQLLARSKATFGSCQSEPSKVSGRYRIQHTHSSEPFEVYCEQAKFGGGWIVFQHRFDGSESFNRSWHEYRDGFGSLDGEFWLGLQRLHELTAQRPCELMVEIKDIQGNYGYAHYNQFALGSAAEKYFLKTLGTHRGPEVNALRYLSTRRFTMNARIEPGKSSLGFYGPWWNNQNADSNLNGLFSGAKDIRGAMYWADAQYTPRRLRYSRIMIRELNEEF